MPKRGVKQRRRRIYDVATYGISMSDHVIVRYLERVEKMDMDALKKRILDHILTSKHVIAHDSASGDKVLVTVLNDDMEYKGPRA